MKNTNDLTAGSVFGDERKNDPSRSPRETGQVFRLLIRSIYLSGSDQSSRALSLTDVQSNLKGTRHDLIAALELDFTKQGIAKGSALGSSTEESRPLHRGDKTSESGDAEHSSRASLVGVLIQRQPARNSDTN